MKTDIDKQVAFRFMLALDYHFVRMPIEDKTEILKIMLNELDSPFPLFLKQFRSKVLNDNVVLFKALNKIVKNYIRIKYTSYSSILHKSPTSLQIAIIVDKKFKEWRKCSDGGRRQNPRPKHMEWKEYSEHDLYEYIK